MFIWYIAQVNAIFRWNWIKIKTAYTIYNGESSMEETTEYLVLILLEQGWSDPDFREGKSTVSKCNNIVVDHITQIPVEYHIHTTIISEYK